MTRFVEAIKAEENTGLTANGAKTNKSSLNSLVDLFFRIGASRGKNISVQFEQAYQTDREMALRILLWARDVRGGAGERETFRKLIQHLEINHFDDALLVMEYIPFFGRWDDLFAFQTEEFKHAVAGMIGRTLQAGTRAQAKIMAGETSKELQEDLNKASLCSKWQPRKGKKAWELRSKLGMTPKQWRKTLVNLTNVIESKMCAKEWDQINFEHVPSVASARYRKAFQRNAGAAYQEFLDKVERGEAKINASAIFPHDVLREHMGQVQYSYGGHREISIPQAALVQWEALPNMLGDNKILPMVDVSESMRVDVGGISAMAVAVSLGLYVADKQSGDFADCFLTFTDRPTIVHETGNVFQKMTKMFQHVGYSTNFEAAYRAVLNYARDHSVEPENMPEYLLVLSDMEFNACHCGDHSVKLFDAAKADFERAGYKLPRMVFWNLNARPGNSPVTFREDGTALVSGYSQNILKGILAADMDQFTPEAIMHSTVMVDRYNIFV